MQKSQRAQGLIPDPVIIELVDRLMRTYDRPKRLKGKPPEMIMAGDGWPFPATEDDQAAEGSPENEEAP